jgi:DNA repair exonuclease SbcCD ATPase subunit
MGGTARMIIEGFEIENWTCINKLTVSGLPPTGVIVLHGPNRTGKSSLVQALRACLMDYSSTSTALKSCYPRGSGEKPTVSVTFTAGGTTCRIKKCFGSNKSELSSRTSTGNWKVETTSAAEAHSRVCDYAGGDDSNKGLRQLLWLTQAEFRLPDPKKFDPDVQAQLRGILGVLQTALDDRFIERVKKRWNTWYSGQRRAGKQHEIKDGCKLAEKLKKLDGAQKELKQSEGKFNEVEGLIRQGGELELLKTNLQQQLADRTTELEKCQEERDRSQKRIAARRLAEERHSNAVKEKEAALEEQRLSQEAAQRLAEDEGAIQPAQTNVDSIGRLVQGATESLDQSRQQLGTHRDERRNLQNRANRIAAKLSALALGEQLELARRDYQRAKTIADEIDEIERYLAEHPAPDEKTLEKLKRNREASAQLRADLKAASINLTPAPKADAAAAQLSVDGGPYLDIAASNAPVTHAVRRKAEIRICDWGRIEVSRDTGSGDLDQIEEDLRKCNEDFAAAVTPLGISAIDPRALDSLLERVSEHRLKKSERDNKMKDLELHGPNGLEALRRKVVELETQTADIPATEPADAESLPADREELEKLAKELKHQLESKDQVIETLMRDEKAAEKKLNEERPKETSAKEELAAVKAKAKSSREQLDRLRSDEQILKRVEDAKRGLEDAQSQLEQTQLTVEESTIDDRLAAADEAVRALKKQIEENTRKYDVLKGRLLESEGLHSRRSSLAARVDELARLTESESLEKDAVDRLYELFQECRQKQLGTLMGPIHDRVLNWMRVLDIGDYKEVRFSDTFLPDRLVRRDGTAEFTIDEESTGAQEQIGMLVRLALGSLLTSTNEPAVAILDDPLTHCDVSHLNKMRVILRRAAEGDPKLTPPAGPLQIIILTCHAEWFRDERATVIDLESPDVMTRFPG